MSFNASYGPQESNKDIFLEKTFITVGPLSAWIYGVQLMLYIFCVKALWIRQRSSRKILLTCYLTLLCAMNTIWTVTAAYDMITIFIDNINFPGGPVGFNTAVEYSLPSPIVSNAAYISGNVFADALLVWRCKVIWSTLHRNFVAIVVMCIPILLLIASTVIGILYAIETASPAGLYGKATFKFAIPYITISPSLNIIVTMLIAGRLLSYRKSIGSVLGKDAVARYTGITAIFIESAALYFVPSALLLSTFAAGNPINQIWFAVTPGIQMVANYLIVYRIAKGSAWSSVVLTNNSLSRPIEFHRPTRNTSLFGSLFSSIARSFSRGGTVPTEKSLEMSRTAVKSSAFRSTEMSQTAVQSSMFRVSEMPINQDESPCDFESMTFEARETIEKVEGGRKKAQLNDFMQPSEGQVDLYQAKHS